MKTQGQLLSEEYGVMDAVELLKQLVAIPSMSGAEEKRADLIASVLEGTGHEVFRIKNNVWAKAKQFDSKKPVLLLNSHLDTVFPSAGYTFDPFKPFEKDDQIFGLGTNDAGASLICLLLTFLKHSQRATANGRRPTAFSLLFLASAEEENSGPNGMQLALQHIGKIDCAIVGEPTEMQMGVAQKGLMVLDVTVKGVSGHAAREEGENAIYLALKDMDWFKTFQFPKESEYLGKIKMTVTQIQSGSQHNVIPGECKFVVDVRTTDAYSNEEILEIIKENISGEVVARSLRLQPSFISPEHPLVKAGLKTDASCFGSPTLSDTALIPFPAFKMGPGKSERSHTADEFILKSEIEDGLLKYDQLLKALI